MCARNNTLEPIYGPSETVNAQQLLSLELLGSLEKYTKAMFKAQYKRSFIVAEHHARIFQALQDVVDGKCRRLIINIAPRYGKCLALDTPILTDKGIKLLQQVQAGDIVYSYRAGKLVSNTVVATEPAFKESYHIIMRSGRQIRCSYDHPMLTTFGYKEAQNIKPGDRIQALRSKMDSTYEIPDAELVLSTVMIFEGNCTGGNYRFATTDPLLLAEVEKACHDLDIPFKHYDCCKSFEYNLLGGRGGNIGKLMQKMGLAGCLAYNKRLPKDWFALSLRQKYRLISLMVATDGCIDQRSGQIVIALANEGLIQDIQMLLSTMGVVSTYVYKATKGVGSWHLAIPRQYAQALYSHLNFYSKEKVARSIMAVPAKSNIDSYPYDIIRVERLTYKTSKAPYRCQSNKNITRDKFKRLVEVFPQELSRYYSEDFYLDEVVKVEPCGEIELKHLEVENDHNFIANGLVSHNTELVIKSFTSWCFALNPKCRFLHLSYSDMLVNDNSDTIRGIMMEDLYKALFPNSALASEKGSAKRWKTKAGGEFYAVSTQGQVTGFGAGSVDEEIDKMDGGNNPFNFDDHTNDVLECINARTNIFNGAILIDDPMKPEEAESDIVRERINLRFENTIRNRTNSRNTPIIIIMQRLHEHDLCGYLKEIEPDEWTVLSLPVIQTDAETGEEHALWPMKHTLEELYRMRELNPVVFDTQYMQDPTPKEGLMYSDGFRTYTRAELPVGSRAMQKWNYTDTADTGADSLCSICFINTPEFVYVTDVLFTDASMEVTEPMQAQFLTRNDTAECLIESNSGGRGYARNVKRLLRTVLKNFKCTINTFQQNQNKKSRIFTASASVQNDILFPEGWERKWPKFYQALMSYRKDNKKKNQHDDAPDCLTGVWEMHAQRVRRRGIVRRN